MRKINPFPWPALVAVLLTTLAAPSTAKASTPFSGISGQVFLYNPYVANLTNSPQIGATTPFYAFLRVYSSNGRLVSTVTTDSGERLGHFRVPLPPGNYLIVPDTMFGGQPLPPNQIVIGRYGSARPVLVRVPPRRFTEVTITYEELLGW